VTTRASETRRDGVTEADEKTSLSGQNPKARRDVPRPPGATHYPLVGGSNPPGPTHEVPGSWHVAFVAGATIMEGALDQRVGRATVADSTSDVVFRIDFGEHPRRCVPDAAAKRLASAAAALLPFHGRDRPRVSAGRREELGAAEATH